MNIVLQNITKKFAEKVILDQVNLVIESGSSVGLIGPNGVGKTTLLRILCHLESKYTGEVYFDQKSNRDYTVFKQVAFMQDNTVLYPHLTGYDHLKLMADVHELEHGAIENIAHEVGITSYLHQKTGTYSLGMKQHLLIAMALIFRPQCVVMDEPFNGLDPTSVYEFKQLLHKLRQDGVTLLISSHNLSIVEALVDKVYLLKQGHLQEMNLQRQPLTCMQLEFDAEQMTQVVDLLTEHQLPVEVHQQVVTLLGQASDYLNVLATHQVKIRSVHYSQRSLEEVYKDYYLNQA